MMVYERCWDPEHGKRLVKLLSELYHVVNKTQGYIFLSESFKKNAQMVINVLWLRSRKASKIDSWLHCIISCLLG